MNNFALTAISPLDGRYSDKLHSLRPVFSEFGLIRFRLIVEIRWLQMLVQHGELPELPRLSAHSQKILNDMIENFSEQDAARVKHIEAGINHDVKAVEYFIKEHISGNKELAQITEFIHFGCTSEDINNLAYALMLNTARQQCLMPSFRNSSLSYKPLPMIMLSKPCYPARMVNPQPPTTVGKEMANFIARLKRQMELLASTPILGKLNGASGNYNALATAYPNIDWQVLSKNFINKLGLTWNPYTTQIEPHDYIA